MNHKLTTKQISKLFATFYVSMTITKMMTTPQEIETLAKAVENDIIKSGLAQPKAIQKNYEGIIEYVRRLKIEMDKAQSNFDAAQAMEEAMLNQGAKIVKPEDV